MAQVEPSLAGPKRPQDRVPLTAIKSSFETALTAPVSERGFALDARSSGARPAPSRIGATDREIGHGAVVIAAITSCTNTSNPSVMLAAGLLAQEGGSARPAACPPTSRPAWPLVRAS